MISNSTRYRENFKTNCCKIRIVTAFFSFFLAQNYSVEINCPHSPAMTLPSWKDDHFSPAEIGGVDHHHSIIEHEQDWTGGTGDFFLIYSWITPNRLEFCQRERGLWNHAFSVHPSVKIWKDVQRVLKLTSMKCDTTDRCLNFLTTEMFDVRVPI